MPSKHSILVGGRYARRPMTLGSGMGSVLLNKGGAGAGSSYPSVKDYEETTGLKLPSGSGLGGKLKELIVKPLVKKPKNISFD